MPMQTAVDQVTVTKAKELKYALPALEVVIVGKWVWVSGNTAPHAYQLRALGLRYASEKQKWYWRPAGYAHHGRPRPYQNIVSRYGEMRVEQAA